MTDGVAEEAIHGRSLIRASWAGTAVFVVVAVAATVAPDALGVVALVVSLVLFAIGTVAFLWGFAIAVGRSRSEAITVGSLFLLLGSAPRRIQVALLVPIGVQTVVALVTASIRLYGVLAFGVLVPMYGLGLAALWSARHGRFPPRAAT